MRSFRKSNTAYEAWMGTKLDVVKADLKTKHERMRDDDAFVFLRATCFRFAEILPDILPKAWLGATAVPSVGDAHLENFGTWRDAEGRLIWGVNDLDESALLPWPVDLLRLAASALLAPGAPTAKEVSTALLTGYTKRLGEPRPFVLDAENRKLRRMANPSLEGRRDFWKKLENEIHDAPGRKPPRAMASALQKAVPLGTTDLIVAPRSGGLGSLGRARFLALGEWRGGKVAREAKARLPSAYIYAGVTYAKLLDPVTLAMAANRAPDPWFGATRSLVLRRIAPDSRKIEVEDAPGLTRLLTSMGGELANFHAHGDTDSVSAEKDAMPDGWLAEYAEHLADAVRADQGAWR